MSAPLATLARLLLRTSAVASESFNAAAASAFGLESVVNRCIRESTRAGELLEDLDGRSLAIIVQGLGICLRLGASKTRLAVSASAARSEGSGPEGSGSENSGSENSGSEGPGPGGPGSEDSGPESSGPGGPGPGSSATATVEGTPLALLGLLRSAGPQAFRESRVRLSGDAQTAEAFAELLGHARPNLEEELSRWIGDIAAHEMAGAARRTGAWARQAGAALTMNTSEFLQEEARQLPPRVEVNAFGRDVERLRDDVERAAQRLARLERHRRRAASREAAADAAAEQG